MRKLSASKLRDHLAGGFHDTPGGPKRLSTNALALLATLQEHRRAPDLFLRQTILDTAAWGLKDLKDGEGAFFSGIGKSDDATKAYFFFDESEVRSALGRERGDEFFKHFDLRPDGFLRLIGSPFAGLGSTRETLLLRRNRRVRLFLDERVDGTANGLWFAALTEVAGSLKRKDELLAAERGARQFLSRPPEGDSGLALGFASLATSTQEDVWIRAAVKELDATLARRDARTSLDSALLVMALHEARSLDATGLRARQESQVLKDLSERFPDSNELAAARCAATKMTAN